MIYKSDPPATCVLERDSFLAPGSSPGCWTVCHCNPASSQRNWVSLGWHKDWSSSHRDGKLISFTLLTSVIFFVFLWVYLCLSWINIWNFFQFFFLHSKAHFTFFKIRFTLVCNKYFLYVVACPRLLGLLVPYEGSMVIWRVEALLLTTDVFPPFIRQWFQEMEPSSSTFWQTGKYNS